MLTIVFQADGGTEEQITLDASVTDTITGEVDITDHPIETGSNVTDHVRKKPSTLKIEGVLLDVEKNTTPELTTVDMGADQPAFVVDTQKTEFKHVPGRSAALFAQLEELRDAARLVEVRTPARVFSNLLIQSLTRTRSKDIAEAVRFSATLREVRIVDSQTVAIKTTVTKAKPKIDGGKQTADKATEAEKKKSLLKHLVGAISDAFKKPGVQ